jgi:ribose transport system ATP-binding protein
MVRLMVGRELQQFFQRKHQPTAERIVPRLELRQLSYLGSPSNRGGVSPPISLALKPGEIVGMAGLVGAGRTELAEAVFGIRRIVSGTVFLDGQPVAIRHPSQAVELGLALVPEDRRLHGLVLEASVQHNICLPNLDRLNVLRLVAGGRERVMANDLCQRLNVRTPSLAQPVGLLSGGNQQKVVLSKWLARRPRVLLFDEPTRGIDVGAKSEIYALMDQLADQGVAILMISSDLEEILGMSDRVLVLHEGRLAGELPRAAMTEESIMHLATGGSVAP